MFGAFYPGQAYPAQAPDYPPIIYIQADAVNPGRVWHVEGRDTAWRSPLRRSGWTLAPRDTSWRD